MKDPSRLQAASEASNDVLFVAFENFMSTWEGKIGPVMTTQELQEVQMNLDQLMPADFQIYFRRFLADMTPVHLTALTEIIKLLADLLEAASNDGDRGALTAAFAELLAHEGDPRFYISLLDRLVEDFSNLFDEAAIAAIVAANSASDNAHHGSVATPHHRSSASFGSTPTSFRKRLGFGSTKDGARSEQDDSPRHEASHGRDTRESSRRDSVKEGRVGSLFRSFTKNKGLYDGANSGSFKGSFTKSSLFRSKSHSDNENRSQMGKQASRDRLAAQNIFSQEEGSAAATKGTPLTSIGEESSQEKGSMKKKNRKKMRRRQSGASSHVSESDRSASQPHAPVTPQRDDSRSHNIQRNFTTPLRPTKSIDETHNTPVSETPSTRPQSRAQSRPATAKDLAPSPRAETPSRQFGPLDKENVSPTKNTSPQRMRPATASFADNPLKRVDFESFAPRASPVKELNHDSASMSPAIKPLRVRMQNPQKVC